MSSLPANLDDVLRDIRPAAHRVAAQGRRRRRTRVLAIALVALFACTAVALAARYYLGQPAPSFLKEELAQYDKGLPTQYRYYPDITKAEVVATNGHAVLYASPAWPRGANKTGRPGACTDLVADGGALGWNWICGATGKAPSLPYHYAATDPTRNLTGETIAGRVIVPGAASLELRYADGAVDPVPLGLRGYYVFDVPAASLPRLRRAPATAIVRGPGGKVLYRERILSPVDAVIHATADGRVTRISGTVPAAAGGHLELYFLLNSNGVRPKLNASGADISTSAQGQVPVAPDGTFSFDVPTGWQRFQLVGLWATSRAHPYGCSSASNCNGFVAESYVPEPAFWPARERAFRRGKG